jgi:hypothetical protein
MGPFSNKWLDGKSRFEKKENPATPGTELQKPS